MSSEIPTEDTGAAQVEPAEAEQQQPEIPGSSVQDIVSLILAALMIIGMVFCFVFLM